MEDFTGGVTETIALKEAPKNLFNMMIKSLKKGALMGCAVEVKTTPTCQVLQKYHCRDSRVCLTAQCAERMSDAGLLVQTERLLWHLHARAASPRDLPTSPTCPDTGFRNKLASQVSSWSLTFSKSTRVWLVRHTFNRNPRRWFRLRSDCSYSPTMSTYGDCSPREQTGHALSHKCSKYGNSPEAFGQLLPRIRFSVDVAWLTSWYLWSSSSSRK